MNREDQAGRAGKIGKETRRREKLKCKWTKRKKR